MASSAAGDRKAAIDPKLLEFLVCPLTKGPLEYDAAGQELISRKAKLAYPIRDGIPIMLPEEARKLDEAERKVTILIKDSTGKMVQQPFEAEPKEREG